MARTPIILAAAATAAASLAACGHHEDLAEGPAGLAYACADGRTARILYGGGDPNRTPARLSFDARDYEMVPDPAASGLRYRSEAGLIWTSEGEEAALFEATPQGEREVVRCTRVREGEAASAEEHEEH
jgi:membrane-bound inhibitor of C-type lysozyme